MLDLDDPRLNAGYRLPDPIHPESLVAAINEVAERYPVAVSTRTFNIVSMVAVELGCSWHEIAAVLEFSDEACLVTDLNEYHTTGAPLLFTGKSLEYWSLLDDLSAQGWTFETMARTIANLHRADNLPIPF